MGQWENGCKLCLNFLQDVWLTEPTSLLLGINNDLAAQIVIEVGHDFYIEVLLEVILDNGQFGRGSNSVAIVNMQDHEDWST